MKIKTKEQLWFLVREILEIQASILIKGSTESKRKRIAKRVDILAEYCDVTTNIGIWYEG